MVVVVAAVDDDDDDNKDDGERSSVQSLSSCCSCLLETAIMVDDEIGAANTKLWADTNQQAYLCRSLRLEGTGDVDVNKLMGKRLRGCLVEQESCRPVYH
jgi:hypothetical protein